MNKYTLAFPFMGEFHFITLNANQFANEAVPHGEDVFDFFEQNPGQEMDCKIYGKGNEQFSVEFCYNDISHLNVYRISDDENIDGTIVQGDGEKIPWLLVKIEDEDGNNLYGLSDYV